MPERNRQSRELCDVAMTGFTSSPRQIVVWLFLQAACSQASLKNTTVCYNTGSTSDQFSCAKNEMILPLKLIVGTPSHSSCQYSTTAGNAFDINQCCKQQVNDPITGYCLPGTKQTITQKYYVDFINNCTGVQRCSLFPSGSNVQHSGSQDYITLEYDCIKESTVMHIKQNHSLTGNEVYLYNNQKDHLANVHCIAYTKECQSTINIDIVANNVLSPKCSIKYDDGFTMDCKNLSPTHNCTPTYRSHSNYVGLSVFMTVDPSGSYTEFLWMKATASKKANVTITCGINVLKSVPNNCPTTSQPTSVSTTQSSTTTTSSSTAVKVTAVTEAPTTLPTSTLKQHKSTPHKTTRPPISRALSAVHTTLRTKTTCYNFMFTTDPYSCSSNSKLLPVMFRLGVSSDRTCHGWISAVKLHLKGPDNIKHCCQQQPRDKIINSYRLPAMKDTIPASYYVDLINTCTGGQSCSLSTNNGLVQHEHGEDYLTFQFACVDDSIILEMNRDASLTGKEVYLYHDQDKTETKVDCIAYTTECYTAVNVEIVATKRVSSACNIHFNDGYKNVAIDCKNMQDTDWNKVQSTANYMKVDAITKEFLWIKASSSANTKVTIACGSKVPRNVSIDCMTTPSLPPTVTLIPGSGTGTRETVQQRKTTSASRVHTVISDHTKGETTEPSKLYKGTTISHFSVKTVTPHVTEKVTESSSSGKIVTPHATEKVTKETGSENDTFFLIKVIGGSAAGLLLLIVIVIGAVYASRKKKKRRRPEEPYPDYPSSSDGESVVSPTYETHNPLWSSRQADRIPNHRWENDTYGVSGPLGRPYQLGPMHNSRVTSDPPHVMTNMAPSYIDDDENEGYSFYPQPQTYDHDPSYLYAKVIKPRKY